jgi:hypothetical protein
VTGRILKIETASVVVDAVFLLVPGVSPIGKSTFCHSAEDGVKFLFGDKEGVVMMFWGPSVVVVETDAIGGLEAHERPERLRGSRPRISARKLADASLSRTGTMVWLS